MMECFVRKDIYFVQNLPIIDVWQGPKHVSFI